MSAKGEGTRAVRALSGREAERSGPTKRERGRGLWGLVRVGPRGKRVREGKGWAAGIGFGPGFVGLGSLFYFYIYFLFLFLTQPQAK